MGIAFDPTYKYVPGSAAVYDSGEASGKVRMPAWCDRVMFSSRHRRGAEHVAQRRSKAAGAVFDGDDVAAPASLACALVTPLRYACPRDGEMVSDHRPVVALFDIRELDKKYVRRVRKKKNLAEERAKKAAVSTLAAMRRAGGEGFAPSGADAGWQY